MGSPVAPQSWVAWYRRHERWLAAGWLLGTLALFVGLAIHPVRLVLLEGLQDAADRWEGRWDRRLAEGERLVAAGQYAAAAPYLERLDREFPARNVRHGRDKQRELLLRLLAASYEGEGKNGKAIAAWRRLVSFDSLNFMNHFGYAQAAERLLSGWALAPEARDGYARAIALMPSHLPSVRGYIRYYMDRGEFIPVTQAYQSYLDSFLRQEVTALLGDTTVIANVLVDGLPHEVDLVVNRPAGWSGELGLRAGGYALRLEQADLVPAGLVGQAARLDPVPLDLSRLSGPGLDQPATAWVPPDSLAKVTLPVPAAPAGVASLRLRLRLYKPVDQALWSAVTKAYQNLLDDAGLALASERTAAFPTAVLADSVQLRQQWAHEGLLEPGRE